MAGYQSYANAYVAPPPPPPGWGQPHQPQAAYGQTPSYQHNPQAPASNAPPLKKQRGNSFATKHPPHSGWKSHWQASGHQPPAAGYEAQQYAAAPSQAYQYSQVPYQQPAHSPTYAHVNYQGNTGEAYQQPSYQPSYQQPPYAAPPQPPYQAPPQASYQPPYQPPYQPHQATSYQQPPTAAYPPSQPYSAPSPAYPPQPQATTQSQTQVFNHVSDTYQPYQLPYPASPSQAAVLPQVSAPIVKSEPSESARSYIRQSSIEHSFLDFDYENETGETVGEVDPRFSLGLIIWHPAEKTTKPLPGTFKEAELEAFAPENPENDVEESLSKYFVRSKVHEVGLSVKETDDWEGVKHDLIFVEFPDTCEVVPLMTIIANRARPDPLTEQKESIEEHLTQVDGTYQQAPKIHPPKPDTVRPAPVELIATDTQVGGAEDDSDGDQAMEMSDDEEDIAPLKSIPKLEPKPQPKPQPIVKQQHPRKPSHVLNSLEKNLGPSEVYTGQNLSRLVSARYSRSRSPEKGGRSRQGSQQPKAKPAPQPRDPTQESVLAALGVEGSPKYVYPTPPPALGLPPPPPSRNGNRSPDRFGPPPNGMYHHPQQFYGPNFPPPPPPPREARSPSYDPWKAHDAMIGNNRYDRSPSRTSQHTAVGSDFHPDEQPDLDATPKAKPPPSQSETPYGQSDSGRKRTYDRMAEIESEGRRRQADDTPRARRKPNYDRTDAYSRRW